MKNNVLKWNLHVLMQMMKEKAENHKIKPLSHVGILLVFTDRVVHIAKEKTLCILEYLEFIIISFSKGACRKNVHRKLAENFTFRYSVHKKIS